MSYDKLIREVNAWGGSHRKTTLADELTHLVAARRQQVADLVRLGEACQAADIDLWPVTARVTDHGLGLVVDSGNDRICGVGSLGHPSILVTDKGRVIITRTDVLAERGVSERPWPSSTPPDHSVELACKGFLDRIDAFEDKFQDYVTKIVNS